MPIPEHLKQRFQQSQQVAEPMQAAPQPQQVQQVQGQGVPPDIAAMINQLSEGRPAPNRVSAAGMSINIPPSREQIMRETQIKNIEQQMRNRNLPPTAQERNQKMSFERVGYVVDKLQDMHSRVNGGERGLEARLGGLKQSIKAKAGYAPEVTAYSGLRTAVLAQLAKTVSGEMGRLTDQDIQRVANAVPSIYSTDEEAETQFKIMREIIAQVTQEAINRGRKEQGLDPVDRSQINIPTFR